MPPFMMTLNDAWTALDMAYTLDSADEGKWNNDAEDQAAFDSLLADLAVMQSDAAAHLAAS